MHAIVNMAIKTIRSTTSNKELRKACANVEKLKQKFLMSQEAW